MEIFVKELVKTGVTAETKDEVLAKMTNELNAYGCLSNPKRFLDAVLEREKQMSTGFGLSLAMPHGRSESVNDFKIVVYQLKNGIDFDSIDGEPVKVIFLAAVSPKHNSTYMKMLSAVSNYFQKNQEKIINAENDEQLFAMLQEIENEI